MSDKDVGKATDNIDETDRSDDTVNEISAETVEGSSGGGGIKRKHVVIVCKSFSIQVFIYVHMFYRLFYVFSKTICTLKTFFQEMTVLPP